MSSRPVSSSASPVSVERRDDGAVIVRAQADWNEDRGFVDQWLYDWADRAPDRIFLYERTPDRLRWDGITYGDAKRQVQALAASLRAMELGPQHPILILSGNSITHQLMSLAAMAAGIPFSPISVAYSTVANALPKLQFVLSALNPGLVYAADGAEFARALRIPEMAGRKIVVGRNADAVPGALELAALSHAGHPAGEMPARTPDTIVKWIFTSGSTGQPKGVITTHRMIRNDVEAIATVLGILPGAMTALDWLPWSHVYGGSFGVGITLRNGGTLYIDDGRPVGSDFAYTIENLKGLSPTLFWNVPKAFEFLVQALEKDEALCKSFFANLSVMLYGAAGLPKPVFDAMNDLVARHASRPIPMLPAWGLTETTTMATIASEPVHVVNAVGIPLPGTTLKLVPSGDKFEARLKGAIITPGYWGQPDVTADSRDEEGFFRTGDALRLADDERPERGLLFEGRIAEDFKLLSGTWVNTTEVRSRCLTALDDLVMDVVVAGQDRDDLALLIFPSRSFSEQDHDTLSAALQRINGGQSGSSRVIARAAIVNDMPSASAGEVTEKGSLNARRILENRSELVEQIYAGTAQNIVLQPQPRHHEHPSSMLREGV